MEVSNNINNTIGNTPDRFKGIKLPPRNNSYYKPQSSLSIYHNKILGISISAEELSKKEQEENYIAWFNSLLEDNSMEFISLSTQMYLNEYIICIRSPLKRLENEIKNAKYHKQAREIYNNNLELIKLIETVYI